MHEGIQPGFEEPGFEAPKFKTEKPVENEDEDLNDDEKRRKIAEIEAEKLRKGMDATHEQVNEMGNDWEKEQKIILEESEKLYKGMDATHKEINEMPMNPEEKKIFKKRFEEKEKPEEENKQQLR